MTLPRSSSVLTACLPSAAADVMLLEAALKVLEKLRPFKRTVSVWLWRLSGSPGVVRLTERLTEAVELSPLGVLSLEDRVSGASMPKRGSGPICALESIPSG